MRPRPPTPNHQPTGPRVLGRHVLILVLVLVMGAPTALARGGRMRADSSKQAQERARKQKQRKRGKGATRVSRKRRKGSRKKATRPARTRGAARGEPAKDTITFRREKGKEPVFGSVKPRPRVRRAGARKKTKLVMRRRKAARRVGWKDPIAKVHAPYQPGGAKPYADGTRERTLRSGTSDRHILEQGERTTSAAEAQRRLAKSRAKGKERLRK